MPHRWPADTDYIVWELDVLDRDCASCGRMMHICDHRYRRFFTLEGPVKLVCKLNHCPDPDCPGHENERPAERVRVQGRTRSEPIRRESPGCAQGLITVPGRR